MIEFREKNVASNDLKDRAPVESKEPISYTVAMISVIGLLLTVLVLLDQTIH